MSLQVGQINGLPGWRSSGLDDVSESGVFGAMSWEFRLSDARR